LGWPRFAYEQVEVLVEISMIKRMNFEGSLEEEPIRYMYGFLESYSKPAKQSSYSRANIAFDCVDADAFDDGRVDDRASPDFLSIVRVMTTPRRLRALFDVSEPIAEGQWFYIGLSVNAGKPRAWRLAAESSYGGAVGNYNLVQFKRINEPDDIKEAVDRKPLERLRAWCKVTPSTQQNLILQVPPRLHVRVMDVGHASSSAVHMEKNGSSPIVGYYDVGGPIFFHHHTFPAAFNEIWRIPEQGFVALSHWDFDHYSLAVTRMKGLQRLQWYAPEQTVGPNAARLQTLLGSRLRLLTSPTFQIAPNLQMWRGTAAPADRNNSGYVLTVAHASGAILLTGDVEYNAIPPAAKTNLIALGVTHHGGNGAGTPPPPMTSGGSAAVSFGLPNHYGHPDLKNIAAHASLGWNVTSTFTSPTQRGDVWLP
jgi:beta-lactamase superfamily II metal-dependent hydrolase